MGDDSPFTPPTDEDYGCSLCMRPFGHPGPCGRLARRVWELFMRIR